MLINYVTLFLIIFGCSDKDNSKPDTKMIYVYPDGKNSDDITCKDCKTSRDFTYIITKNGHHDDPGFTTQANILGDMTLVAPKNRLANWQVVIKPAKTENTSELRIEVDKSTLPAKSSSNVLNDSTVSVDINLNDEVVGKIAINVFDIETCKLELGAPSCYDNIPSMYRRTLFIPYQVLDIVSDKDKLECDAIDKLGDLAENIVSDVAGEDAGSAAKNITSAAGALYEDCK